MKTNNFNQAQKRQLTRFCAYGFLKNLQFFEPFLILVFLDRGFSFAQIGLLIAIRAICVNIMEIPSGAIADVLGRRNAMVTSMIGYMSSFCVFAFASQYHLFILAMVLFSVGEAFRTGTHKAMIFDWLIHEDLTENKSRIYGLTRSWSKQGSSLNCLIAAAILILLKDYRWIFLLALIPYSLNIINLLSYPAYLDAEPTRTGTGMKKMWSTLKESFLLFIKRPQMLRLLLENVCFEGLFSVTKDFLQPTIKAVAVGLPIFLTLSGDTRTAILIAAVYLLLNQLSSLASRFSHKTVTLSGSEPRAAALLWAVGLILYSAMTAGFIFSLGWLSITSFVLLAMIFNIWKPLLVGRFHDHAERESAATTLSIVNQSKTLSVAIIAPLLGTAVDSVMSSTSQLSRPELFHLWPIAAAGLTAAVLGLLINYAPWSQLAKVRTGK